MQSATTIAGTRRKERREEEGYEQDLLCVSRKQRDPGPARDLEHSRARRLQGQRQLVPITLATTLPKAQSEPPAQEGRPLIPRRLDVEGPQPSPELPSGPPETIADKPPSATSTPSLPELDTLSFDSTTPSERNGAL
ncbi:hypothetical protein BHM03_00005342 [Ensete ventricosum]|nr:hypothetical protein BHM03_00005342 [Ensete ventricosum]